MSRMRRRRDNLATRTRVISKLQQELRENLPSLQRICKDFAVDAGLCGTSGHRILHTAIMSIERICDIDPDDGCWGI